ncbi:MAG: CARDB domain-containing protein [Candidatus Bathyarchaeia archaeon]|jgi:hypothetical protein
MNKRTLEIAILITVLVLNFMIVFAKADSIPPPYYPHTANAMWIEPFLVFNTAHGFVGQTFNITVWMNITENVFAYQVGLRYNRTQLECTGAGYTATATGRSQFFAGHSTQSPPPVIDGGLLGNGSVLGFESLLGSDQINGPSFASLMWVEFQILIVPASGNLTSTFDITSTYASGDTFVLDPSLSSINITLYNANYTFIGPSGLTLSIMPTTSAIFVGQTVHFTSTVSGGIPSYSFQWYLNGTPVLGATSNNWDYTPAAPEYDLVHLSVTDSNGTTVTSTPDASVTVKTPGGAIISVSPPEIFDLTMGPSSTFYINITLANAANLGLCAFNLTYDPSIINWIGMDVFRVQGQLPIATITLNGNAGFLRVSLNYSTPFTTDPPVPMLTMQFHVEAYGISLLNLTDTQLLDGNSNPITHFELDGLFSNIIRDVAVTNVVAATKWIYQGWSDDISVTVKNLGNVSETFTASVYYNSSLIGVASIVSLAPNAETTTTIPWNTTGVPEGNYTITGVASIVPYEYNTTNNVYVDGIVEVVTIIHDVAITNVTPANTWAYHGNPLKINVTAANLGNVSETFNVTAYADNDTIGTFSITNLPANAQMTITFVWNTTAAQLCHNYTISGVASPIPHEYNATNNVYVDGTVTMRLVGDVNGDGKVDGKDIAIIAKAFGAYGPDKFYPGSPPSSNWNHDADINLDNVVDGRDIVLAAKNFGQFC